MTISPPPGPIRADFRDRVALITGGGSGIGAATAARFAGWGARVVIADLNPTSADATANAINTAIGTPVAQGVGLDVSDEKAVATTVSTLIATGGPIDILVNNAGVAAPDAFAEIPRSVWDRDLAVCLTGSYLMSQAVLGAMVERQSGVIVNVASVNGVGYYGNEAYSAAKAGLLSLTKSLAVAYGKHGIRCNAVVPGTIATPIWQQRVDTDPTVLSRLTRWYPLGRVGRPEDVAAAITFLASDDAGWITGAALPVDGGLLAGNQPMTDDILGR